MNIYVPGKGPLGAKIAIVAEAPSYEEETQLQPLVGPSGRFLNAMLAEAGINRNDCWVTNVCKYMVPPNPKTGKKIPFYTRAASVGINMQEQVSELITELNTINPNVLILLGGTALFSLSGKTPINSWRGSIIKAINWKAIPTYHPAHILHQEGEVKGYWNKSIMLFDLKRAKQQSLYSDIRLPVRRLEICRSSEQFYDFIKRYEGHKNPSVDIEAFKCIPSCIGFAFTPEEGITIPLWNTNGISDIPTSDIVNLWSLVVDFLAKHDVVGQNFGYDRDKIRRLGFTIRSLFSDTMLKAFAINPEFPKNLAFNTSIYTEEPYYKDEGMYEGSTDDLLIGCARDACVTKEVDIKMQPDIDEYNQEQFYRNFLLPLHELYFYNENLDAIEQVGFRVDFDKRKQLIRKYIEWDEDLRYELFKLTGQYVNSNSWQQVAKLLYDDLGISARKGTGEEVLTSLLNTVVKNPHHRRVIEVILEDRSVKKTTDSYAYCVEDYDGRLKSSYFLCLETGRSSTNKQEAPVRPNGKFKDPKDNKLKDHHFGIAIQTLTKHGDIGADLRTMLIADEGEIFLQPDSTQAEARVVMVLADDEEGLKLYDEHDVHAVTASWFFGGTEYDFIKIDGKEKPERFAGKTLRHAGNLGAGKRRAATELNTQARKYKVKDASGNAYVISEKKAELALSIFHARSPKIRTVFHAGIIRCLEKDRTLIAPVPYGIDATYGGSRIFYERWGDELFRQAFSYLPQRTVSENTKQAAQRIKARAKWIRILSESHDALVCSVPIGRKRDAALIIKEEFERPIDFRTCSIYRDKQLVIPCEIEEGYNYKDLSKFKWMIPDTYGIMNDGEPLTSNPGQYMGIQR